MTREDEASTDLDALIYLFFPTRRYRAVAAQVLLLLRDRPDGGNFTRALAREMEVPVATMADVLATLKEAGLARRACDDGSLRFSAVPSPWRLSSVAGRRLGACARAWEAFVAGAETGDAEGLRKPYCANGLRESADGGDLT